MTQTLLVPLNGAAARPPLPPGFVPTPSAAYRQHRGAQRDARAPAARQPAPALQPQAEPGAPHQLQAAPSAQQAEAGGARLLMWKQDPAVAAIGVRKTYLPGAILAGPSDARIANGTPGIEPVSPNAFGDFIATPDSAAFDAVHTYAVVRQTLSLYQRALAADGVPAPLPWQWNDSGNSAPLGVFPHGLPDVMNAYYSRNEGALRFGHFLDEASGGRVYTCRSLDIVAHETGHAVLDGLKPSWLLFGNPPQTGGLHDKTFLSDMAEQFGLALGRDNGLRNADNDLKLSEAGNEVHAISQVFTGAIYDILADIFGAARHPEIEDDAAVLHRVAAELRGLLLRALIAAPDFRATYADVANQMLQLAATDGKPAPYLGFIRDRFSVREVLSAGSAAALAGAAGAPLLPLVQDAPGTPQNRRGCCGTMHHAEYGPAAEQLEQERQAMSLWFGGQTDGARGANGHGGNGHRGNGGRPPEPVPGGAGQPERL